MHFTQPFKQANLGLWESPGNLFPVPIILEHFRSLTNGLAVRKLALTISRKFGGQMAFVAQAAD